MGCPYLKQIVMSRCEATWVKKAVPTSSLVRGLCEGDFESCVLFREALERLERAAESERRASEDARESTPTAGED